MTWLLERQERLGTTGDLLELGCYLGKSAILIGKHLRPGETFTVCDLFDAKPEDLANEAENKHSYPTLTRQGFEANYLAFYETLPVIVQSTTDQILKHVAPDSCRFVHVDASHLWEHVRGDLEAAQFVLNADGVVVCDDYRSEHTPGVAAAVWSAVANGGLKPICVTGNKLYGTWGDPEPIQDDLVEWLRSHRHWLPEFQNILDHRVVRVRRWEQPPLPTFVPRGQQEAPVPLRQRLLSRDRWPRAHKLAYDLLPPVLTTAIKRARSR